MRPWTQLLEAWEKNPEPDAAIALCEALDDATDPTALPAIGRRLATRHASDARVLIALGRALLAARRLGEAQSVLVSAGKVEPKNADVYLWLGEVLLLRGDAERAAKVLDRAVSLGKDDEQTTARANQAREYVEIQQRYGPKAVADDVAQQSGGPPVAPPTADAGEPERGEPDADQDDFDDVTVVRPSLMPHEPTTDPDSNPMRPAAGSDDWENPHPPALPDPPARPARTGTLPPPPMVPTWTPIPALPEQPMAPAAIPRAPAPRAGRFSSPPPALPPPVSAPRPIPAPPAVREPSPSPPTVARSAPPSPQARPPAAEPIRKGDAVALLDSPRAARIVAPPPPAFAAPEPVYEPPTNKNAVAASSAKSSILPEPPRSRQGSLGPPARLPTAPRRPPNVDDVLDALATAGVFETSAPAACTWEPPRTRPTLFLRALAVLTVALLGSGAGGFYYVRDLGEKQTSSARMLDAQAAASLSSATRIQEFQKIESKLAHAFELSASRTTSLLWVKERVLRSLLVDADTSGIVSAIRRAGQVGVPESDLAFARVASYLLDGDATGAALLAARWEERASKDPLFQLVLGVVLERAGDQRAGDRYDLAAHLDPDLLAAQVMLARTTILERDPAKGLELARAVAARWPDRAEGPALVGLAWARDTPHGPAPTENAQTRTKKADLCRPLRAVPSIIEAVDPTESPGDSVVDAAFDRALADSDSASLAAAVGSLALGVGHVRVATRAAARARALVADYGPARLLAAKAAFSARAYLEAKDAADGLDPSSPQVAVMKAAIAYECMDIKGLASLIERLPADVREHPDLAALGRAADFARSPATADTATLQALAGGQVPWGAIVAMDAAMDSGNLALARQLLDGAHDAKSDPSWALRRARFLRVSDRAADADEPSKLALSGLRCPRAIVERALVLVAISKTDQARRVIADNAAALGPFLPWIEAYVEADGPRAAEARAQVASLAPPPTMSALGTRVIAVMALARLHEKTRGTELIRAMAKAAGHNPDFIAAAIALR
jgi:hypothetical protein